MEKFATVSWTVEDVLEIRPEWTPEQAKTWLEDNQKSMRDRLIELGWQVMENLMLE